MALFIALHFLIEQIFIFIFNIVINLILLVLILLNQ